MYHSSVGLVKAAIKDHLGIDLDYNHVVQLMIEEKLLDNNGNPVQLEALISEG